ncbi:hypothetical protein BASA60_009152 [Batrachochytrium salamandrivorans]|nr:hypothetical protein BASA60_009152 [Batrachochytrium salamandrivorans]
MSYSDYSQEYSITTGTTTGTTTTTTTGSDKEDAARWLSCEVLSNVGQLKIVLSPHVNHPYTQILLTPTTLELRNSSTSRPRMMLPETTASLRLTLPLMIDPTSLKLSQSRHYITLSLSQRLLSNSTSSTPSTTGSTPSLPRGEDIDISSNWLSSRLLCCHNCQHVLAGSIGHSSSDSPIHQQPSETTPVSTSDLIFKRYIDLPSQYWHEMLECWACHHEDYSSTLQGQQGGLILAQRDAVLVGDSYFIVHPANMCMDSLMIVYTGNESIFNSTRWIRIVCRRCRNPVGECFMESGTSSDSLDLNQVQIVKLFKYRVDVVMSTGSTMYTPFVDCFVSEILEIAKAHATYRFYVHDEDSLDEIQPVLYLWLFSTNIQATRIRGSGVIRPPYRPAIKVLYKMCDKVDVEQASTQGKQTTERLYIASDLVANLIQRLRKNAIEQLPTSERRLFGFEASVLYTRAWSDG